MEYGGHFPLCARQELQYQLLGIGSFEFWTHAPSLLWSFLGAVRHSIVLKVGILSQNWQGIDQGCLKVILTLWGCVLTCLPGCFNSSRCCLPSLLVWISRRAISHVPSHLFLQRHLTVGVAILPIRRKRLERLAPQLPASLRLFNFKERGKTTSSDISHGHSPSREFDCLCLIMSVGWYYPTSC